MRSAVAGRAFLVCLLLVGGVAAPVTADASGARDAGRSPGDVGGSTAQVESGTLHQEMIVVRNPDSGTVTVTATYTVPSQVTNLAVDVPAVADGEATVVSGSGFRRSGTARFEWDERTATPSITLRLGVGEGMARGVHGVEGDEWAFVVEPNTNVRWSYRGAPPEYSQEFAVDGEGYVRDHMAYVGPYRTRSVSVDGERTTFVLGADADVNLSDATGFLEVAHRRFGFDAERDETTVFVLPLQSRGVEHVAGATIEASFWVTEPGVRIDDVSAVFPHEYVHTRLGTVGADGAKWLNEASAEYYGHVFALNYGVGSYDQFRRQISAESFGPNGTRVVLENRSTWSNNLGNYEKGAHVLAALDAEIRQRTNGARTLRDVYVRHPEEFDGYASFRSAVVEVTGEESLGPWLDRYVTTGALPPLPNEPSRYVVGEELDPDDDGLTSGRERDVGTNPFLNDTDGDGVDDGRELEIGTDPTQRDTDGDGVDDAADRYPTNPDRITATPTPTATPTATESSTPTATEPVTPTKTEAMAPGFGIAAALAALLVAASRT
ncbi:hypothetical protein ACFQJD_10835 [Haloplanus sp. GCM10025708]|uniref:hypothetical protein n=1 Tax=Haloferacaceae TaxID=1644056 RepID=UPI0036232F4A